MGRCGRRRRAREAERAAAPGAYDADHDRDAEGRYDGGRYDRGRYDGGRYDDPPRRTWRARRDRRPVTSRLYRDPDQGPLFGVCAGLADHFGVRAWVVRAGAVGLTLFFFPWPLLIYGIAAMVMARRPDTPVYETEEEETFWRQAAKAPSDTLTALRDRFRALEGRLAGLERNVTSDEYRLRREIEELERRG